MTPADEYEALMAEVVRAARHVNATLDLSRNPRPSLASLVELRRAINELDGK
jgi:hypothetical protein